MLTNATHNPDSAEYQEKQAAIEFVRKVAHPLSFMIFVSVGTKPPLEYWEESVNNVLAANLPCLTKAEIAALNTQESRHPKS